MRILEAYDRFVWTVAYRNVRRLSVNYPGDLMFITGSGFGDLGYHELTASRSELLQHEILFRSGSTILVEFQGVEIQVSPRV